MRCTRDAAGSGPVHSARTLASNDQAKPWIVSAVPSSTRSAMNRAASPPHATNIAPSGPAPRQARQIRAARERQAEVVTHPFDCACRLRPRRPVGIARHGEKIVARPGKGVNARQLLEARLRQYAMSRIDRDDRARVARQRRQPRDRAGIIQPLLNPARSVDRAPAGIVAVQQEVGRKPKPALESDIKEQFSGATKHSPRRS